MENSGNRPQVRGLLSTSRHDKDGFFCSFRSIDNFLPCNLKNFGRSDNPNNSPNFVNIAQIRINTIPNDSKLDAESKKHNQEPREDKF